MLVLRDWVSGTAAPQVAFEILGVKDLERRRKETSWGPVEPFPPDGRKGATPHCRGPSTFQ